MNNANSIYLTFMNKEKLDNNINKAFQINDFKLRKENRKHQSLALIIVKLNRSEYNYVCFQIKVP